MDSWFTYNFYFYLQLCLFPLFLCSTNNVYFPISTNNFCSRTPANLDEIFSPFAEHQAFVWFWNFY